MDEQQEPNTQGSAPFQDRTVWIFISLYLILIAFFMVMNAISNQETARADAVIESLNTTFKNAFEARGETINFLQQPKTTAPNDEFVGSIEALQASIFALEDRFPSPGGNRFVVRIPTVLLFAGQSTKLRPDRVNVLEQLAELIASARPGEHRELTFFFGLGDGGAGPVVRRRALMRAGDLARNFTKLGVPRGSVAAGINAGNPDEIAIALRAVAAGSDRISFDEAGTGDG